MAELNIAERQAGDVTVLDMSGKITIGEGSVALRTAIRRWRQGLSFGERVRSIFGGDIGRPVELDFPPGEL